MALPATDNFNRANANPIGGNWTTVTGKGNIQIVSNVAIGTISGINAAYWNADAFSNNQYSQVKLGAVASTWFGPAVRFSSSAYTGYLAESSNGTSLVLYKVIAGTTTSLASYTVTVSAGDIIRLEVVGSTLTVKHNGTTRITHTNAEIASGSCGLWVNDSDAAKSLDDWEGGSFSIPVAMYHYQLMRNS